MGRSVLIGHSACRLLTCDVIQQKVGREGATGREINPVKKAHQGSSDLLGRASDEEVRAWRNTILAGSCEVHGQSISLRIASALTASKRFAVTTQNGLNNLQLS